MFNTFNFVIQTELQVREPIGKLKNFCYINISATLKKIRKYAYFYMFNNFIVYYSAFSFSNTTIYSIIKVSSVCFIQNYHN